MIKIVDNLKKRIGETSRQIAYLSMRINKEDKNVYILNKQVKNKINERKDLEIWLANIIKQCEKS